MTEKNPDIVLKEHLTLMASALKKRQSGSAGSRAMAYRLSEGLVEAAYHLAMARSVTLPQLVRKMLEDEIATNPEEVARGAEIMRATLALNK